MKRMVIRLLVRLLPGLLLLAACQADTPASPTAAPAETAVPEPVACPEATADTALYRNDDNGVCFLYPASFAVETQVERPDEVVWLRGPQLVQGQEAAVVTLRVAFNGPAEGLTAQEYAEMWRSLYVPEMALPVQTMTVGGQTAALITDVPGMFPEQSAFVVANGMKYQLILQPQPGLVPELTEATEQVWRTVTDSIVFFAPAVVREWVRPDDVCPAATAETEAHRNLREGFCLLYPADFELDPRFASGFVGGPVIVDDPTFGEIRASFVMASAGPAQGQTPRQLLEPRLEFVDQASIQDTTIGGAPAVVFVDPREPFASRQAMIVANEMLYTIVNQPYDPQRYPDAVQYVDQVWDTVVGSVAFFEPWR